MVMTGWGTHRAPLAVVGLEVSLKIREWGGSAEQLLGVSAGAALDRDIDEVVPAIGGAAAWRALLAEADGTGPVTVGLVDGRTIEWSAAPVRDAHGERVGAIGYGSDVTARVAEQRARELDHVMLRIVLDNVPIVITAFAPDGEYLFFDGKGLAGLGMTSGMLLGQNVFKVFADSPAIVDYVRRGLAGERTPSTSLFELGRHFENWHIPAPPGGRAAMISVSLDVSDAKFREAELESKLSVIERQQQVIRELSTPILEVWDGVLALPIIGLVDSVRTAEIMDNLLQSVGRHRARFAILDMTGIDVVDTATANHIIGMIRAVRLLGAEGIITGINPGIAQTVVTLGVELRDVTIHATLREALKYCIAGGRSRRG